MFAWLLIAGTVVLTGAFGLQMYLSYKRQSNDKLKWAMWLVGVGGFALLIAADVVAFYAKSDVAVLLFAAAILVCATLAARRALQSLQVIMWLAFVVMALLGSFPALITLTT